MVDNHFLPCCEKCKSIDPDFDIINNLSGSWKIRVVCTHMPVCKRYIEAKQAAEE